MLGEYSMSTTLTNGLKLPDKGSVDWYADMQSNYAILDGAVGTIAEHTSALAGKAPLVHTHTKSDITDFPAYGNAAGTICEGYDSRLSDARTPVAHTHDKADITDLFNSANVWSAENTYTNTLLTLKHTALEVGVLPDSNQTKRYRFTDKNNVSLGWVQHRVNTSGDSYLEIYSVNKFSNGQFSPQGSDAANSLIVGLHSDGTRYAQVMSDFYPAYTNLNCNLGSSTNRWKTLNGINPGALSLPNTPGGTGTVNVNYYDLSGNITVRDGSTYNRITAPCDGWIAIGTFATWLQISNDTLILATTANPGADGFAQAFLPVRKGNSIRIVVNQTNTQFQSFKLLPCEGNV